MHFHLCKTQGASAAGCLRFSRTFGDPSLLARLTNQVRVLKDFGTVLEMSREGRQAILAQLREIYDGRLDKAWGNGRTFSWEVRLGFVAGMTQVIDQHQSVMGVLGERFVLVRPRLPGRQSLALAALLGSGRESQMRQAIAAAIEGYLGTRPIEQPSGSSCVNRMVMRERPGAALP